MLNNEMSDLPKNKKTKKAKVRLFQKKQKGNSEKEIIEKLRNQYQTINLDDVRFFSDFPLSFKTLKGLKECGYKKPTEIQKASLGLSLCGKDVLGAAKTGSGKTLAFLVPILEVLYCKQWTHLDGLGALVITPTRELAYQIFETLRRLGQHHDFSAGLVIGGKDLKFERKRMDQCNIIIGTPGRILQHMDENPLFDCVNLKILILDEADRCLDMGFQETMNAIIANLPPERQTLLFSATQTTSVKDLARLSLKNASYVSVHENSIHSTPENLQQNYIECELHEKVSIIYSFIKNHLKQKMIIFFSSCKQVKYIYEIFCRLRPGTSLLALYGTLHQLRRMDIYETFCRKQSAVLFATDLAARGLDFPEVHWVVQADCPEDAATYIHRVGRTARYHRGGESLLLLLPSEKISMLEQLSKAKIPINDIRINMNRIQNPVRKMEAFLARDVSLKDTAQRAFVSYAKSVFLMKNKSIFDVRALDTDSFAHSLGLAVPPRIRFLQRLDKKTTIDKSKSNSELPNTKIKFKASEDSSEIEEYETVTPKTSTSVFHVSDDYGDDDAEDNVLVLKRKDHVLDEPLLSESELLNMDSLVRPKKPITKAAVVKKMIKKKIIANKKITFNEEGEAIFDSKTRQSELARNYENEDKGGIDIETAKLVLREEDKFDKKRFREKVKAKHKEEKRRLKELKLQKEEIGEKDEFGSGDSVSDGPDLSWLPDPDKLYGKVNEPKSTQEEEVIADDVQKRTPKRKLKQAEKRDSESSKKKKTKSNVEIDDLSVNETEELALMLLKGKKS